MTIRPVGGELFHADGRTDEQTVTGSSGSNPEMSIMIFN